MESALAKFISPKDAALEHERLTSLINSMGDGVLAIDQDQKVVVYNGAALNILDRNAPMYNKRLSTILKLIDKDEHPVDIHRMVAEAKTPIYTRDLRMRYSDDNLINLYLSIAPVRLGFGKRGSQGYVILMRDITREKSLEEERDEFISVTSHELRTPIAIAEGNISNALLVAEKNGDKDQIHQALNQAHEQIKYLAEMINDLATLSRAERGKLDVKPEQINVHELLVALADNYRPQAEARGLQLNLELDPQLELLSSSKLYVREILQNFITNALKYTQKGYITLSAISKKDGVEFSVTDTGIGIGTSDQAKVFNKFFRSEDYQTKQTKGTGLGLYVTRKLAKLLKGRIELASELHKGSVFKIFIPNINS